MKSLTPIEKAIWIIQLQIYDVDCQKEFLNAIGTLINYVKKRRIKNDFAKE